MANIKFKKTYMIVGSGQILNGIIGYHLTNYSWTYSLIVILSGLIIVLVGENL